MCGFPSRLKRMRSIALASVAVPTVERGSEPIRSWSTMIAVVSPSRTSTSGRASVGMKPCTKELYVSLISRCDSAAIVPNTSELLPEPEKPVNTVSRRFGISMLTSLRLFTRAPCTRIRSWWSATCSAGDRVSVVVALLIVPPPVGRAAFAVSVSVAWLDLTSSGPRSRGAPGRGVRPTSGRRASARGRAARSPRAKPGCGAGVAQPEPNGSGGGEVPAGRAVRRRGHQQPLVLPVEGQRQAATGPCHRRRAGGPSRCRLGRSWPRSPDGSAELVDADVVARGIAEGAVANPVRLLGRLLDDVGVAGLQPREGAVEVLGGQDDDGVGSLGHHLGDGAALVVGDAGVGGRRVQDDGRAELVGGADRDPAHPLVSDVVADLEAEGVAVEGQGGVRVVVRKEARVNGDVHGSQTRCGSVAGASRFLIGLVACFATHDGIPAVARCARRR